jgi:16S rRNA (guanine966-N2)-methyltransferase
VADLFAGTGAVGLEALSRGAAWAAFAERDRSALAALSENIRRLGVQDRSLVLPLDWESACRRLAAGGGAFGLVFADPPYDTDLAERCLRSRFTDAMLAPGGLVVIEHRRTRVLPPPPDHLALLDQRRAGEAVFSIYQRRSGAACEPSTRARSIP